MKKLGILVITLALLTVGFAMADSGMKPVPETQGISTSTSIDGTGNMESHTDLMWTITNKETLLEVPPLDDTISGSTIYAASYQEDTMNEGTVGEVGYDKELDIETAKVGSGLSNIQTTKIITFEGAGSRLTSEESIYIDGAGIAYKAPETPVMCPFAPATEGISNPAFCNRAEASSYIDMSVANVVTTADTRFIINSADDKVNLNYEITVQDLDGAPSVGQAVGSMEVVIREGRMDGDNDTGMFEEVKYTDSTDVFGAIMYFNKEMAYESSPTR